MNGKKIMAGLIASLILCFNGSAMAEIPQDVPKDVKYILGFYYGNGENILIRENKGELELLYRFSREDKCFDKANIFPLSKNHFDSYTLNESGPVHNTEVNVGFERDANGYGITCKIGGHRYSRYFFGNTTGENALPFRLPENESWDNLVADAHKAVMPAAMAAGKAAELVNLQAAGIKVDSRYAVSDNLFGKPLYTAADLYLDKEAAEALQAVNTELSSYGLGIMVWDAYRPWSVSKLAYSALPDNKKYMLENPDEKMSKHNTGLAADVTLYDLQTGMPIEMISDFDEPSLRQYYSYPGGTARQRYLRTLLREVMEKHGFTGIEMEWWHFEYQNINEYGSLNIPLENLQ